MAASRLSARYLRGIEPDGRIYFSADDVFAVGKGELAGAAKKPAAGGMRWANAALFQFSLHLSGKCVTAPVHGPDDAGVVVLSDGLPNLADDFRQAGIRNKNAFPDPVNQFVF
jgi:hypothetical protein